MTPTPPSRPGLSCLVLHGLGGGLYEVAPVIEALRDAGLRVESPVLPGHEGPGPIMPASSWRDWAASVEAAYDETASAGGPVAVVGFSTGGTLALWLASRRPVARLVLLAPFLAIRLGHLMPMGPAACLRAIARVMPHLRRRPPAVRDRVLRQQIASEGCFRTFSLAAAVSALELIEEIKLVVPSITTPTLILQGRRDTVVEPRGASWLHERLGFDGQGARHPSPLRSPAGVRPRS